MTASSRQNYPQPQPELVEALELSFARHSHGLGWLALRRFVRRPAAMSALSVVVALFVAGALASTLARTGWNAINLSPNVVHQAPSLSHPFGTDQIGRDMAVRTLYGIRTTEEVALASAVVAAIIGLILGALAGYYGGWLDAIVMRVADLVTAYPAVVLTLAVIVYVRVATPKDLIFIFCGYMWAYVARVVRAHFVGLREQEFVEAARAMGGSNVRIIVRHLLPNAAGTVLIAATSLVGQVVLIDATVEFFNYGLSSSVSPSLGNLISDVVQTRFGLIANSDAVPGVGWWTWFFPSLVLAVILISVNFVGDALDAALNPV